MTYHNYISFYLYFIFVFYLFLGIESFTPAGRLAHSSVLVGNKLYFFGGVFDSNFCSNEVFYLDVSQQFNVASPPWNDLTANEGMPIKSCWGTFSLSEANNEQSIYSFGGITGDIITNNDSFKSFTYKLNLKSGQWEMPIINGKAPERRREMRAINDNSGKIFIFGGGADQTVGSLTLRFFNDMAMFNVAELSWSISNPSNAPSRRSAYSATILSNGVIIYIGGYEFVGNIIQNVDISQINLYDTKSLTWSVRTAKLIGQIESRHSHTAVLVSNGKIIIHGGCKPIGGNFNAQVTPDIAILNTETFDWTIPLVSSNIGIVPSLTSHTTNLVGNYMIAAFGNITQLNAIPLPSRNANIYIMDIISYTWIDTFEPENKKTPSNNFVPTSSTTSAKTTSTSESKSDVDNQLTTMKIAIGTISGVVGTAVLIAIGIFSYRWYKRRQRMIIRIPGSQY